MIHKNLACIAFIALPLIASATEYQTVERPRQQCWNERVPVESQGSGYGGAVIGGIAGGLLGNQVGGGNGKTVATAIGAATGAVAGDRIAGRSQPTTQYQTVQRCKTVIDHVRVPVVYEAVPVYQERRYYIEDEPKGRREHRKHHRHDDDDDHDDEHHGDRRHGHED